MTSATATVSRGRGSDFAALAREIKQADLLDRRRGFYPFRIALNLLVLPPDASRS